MTIATTEEQQQSSTKTVTKTTEPMEIQEPIFRELVSDPDIPQEDPSQGLNYDERLEESNSMLTRKQNVQSELRISHYKKNKITATSLPISIYNNTNFATQAALNGWTGDGSLANPYILENLVITASAANTHAISIQNTDVYFILRNSTLTATGSGSSGLYFNNVHNGTINNNTANYNVYGFQLYLSSSNTLSHNTANYNIHIGFRLYLSSNNTLSYNTANYNTFFGFYLHSSNNNALSSIISQVFFAFQNLN